MDPKPAAKKVASSKTRRPIQKKQVGLIDECIHTLCIFFSNRPINLLYHDIFKTVVQNKQVI
ncbi:hypothetical protein DPEC_G00278870, partial [Dallia pectoralis]